MAACVACDVPWKDIYHDRVEMCWECSATRPCEYHVVDYLHTCGKPDPFTVEDAEVMVARRFRIGMKRSPEYRDGYRSWMLRLADGRTLTDPYPVGSATLDAWYAGLTAAQSDQWLISRTTAVPK